MMPSSIFSLKNQHQNRIERGIVTSSMTFFLLVDFPPTLCMLDCTFWHHMPLTLGSIRFTLNTRNIADKKQELHKLIFFLANQIAKGYKWDVCCHLLILLINLYNTANVSLFNFLSVASTTIFSRLKKGIQATITT